MLSLAIAVAISASIVRAASTLNESRFKPQYFTRKRILPFEKLLRYLLSMHKSSTQCALNDFLERKGITMSQQALSKARSKFDHTPFPQPILICFWTDTILPAPFLHRQSVVLLRSDLLRPFFHPQLLLYCCDCFCRAHFHYLRI